MKETLPEYMLREKLQGYASPVDQGIFDRVMQARRQEKGRPSVFWWLLPVALLTGGLALSYLGGDAGYPLQVKSSRLPHPGTNNDGRKTNALPANVSSAQGRINDAPGEIIRINHKIPESAIRHKTKGINTPFENSLSGINGYRQSGEPTPASWKYGGQGNSMSGFGRNEKNLKATRREMQSLDMVSFFSGKNPSLASNSLPPVHLFIPGCPDLGIEKRNDWYIEAFVGPDLPRKTLSDAWDKSGFAEKKDSTEKFLLSYSAGIRLVKNISKDWLMKTGIHYSQFNEKFEYRNETEKRITTVITIRTVIRGPGDTLLVRDTSQVEVTGTRVKTTYNRYRNIDIPLLLSYEMRKPGFTLAVNGGVTFNIISAFHGDMIDTSGAPMSDAGKNAATQLKSRLGLGLYAGLSFIRPVSPTLDVFAEPYYRRYINNQATDAAPFKQYISNWGIQLGIRYNLNASGQRY